MDSRGLTIVNTDALDRSVLGQCYRKATESPDTSTQLGSVIMDAEGYIRWETCSFNGFVHGWVPTEADYERPRKYQVTEHAERRAIYKAAKFGVALEGATLYCTWAACVDCARAIVESGISRLVRHYPPLDDATERWLESVSLGDQIMKKGGVKVKDILGLIPESFPILRGGESFDPAVP